MENGGEQCTTCHHLITSADGPLNPWWQSEEIRTKIAKICLAELFSELIDSSLIFRVSNGELQPFCNKCLEELENISKMDDESENIRKQIDTFVDNFTMKSLRSRKAKGKFIISERNTGSTEEITVTSPKAEKLPTFGENRKKCCKICSDDYARNNLNEKLETETVRKILNVCEKHFFKELISNDCFDWNSIGLNKFLSFCGNCLDTIKIVSEMDDELEKAGNEVSTAAEKFVIALLKSRKSVKEKGINKRYPDYNNASTNLKFDPPIWDAPVLSSYSPVIENLNCDGEGLLIADDCDNGEKPQIIISNPRSLLSTENNDGSSNSSGLFRQATLTPTIKASTSIECNSLPQNDAMVVLQKSLFPTIKLENIYPTQRLNGSTAENLEVTPSVDEGSLKKKSRIPKPLRDPVYEWNVKKYKVTKRPNISCNGVSTVRKTKVFHSIIKCTNCPKVFAYVGSFEKHAKICQMKISFADNGKQVSEQSNPESSQQSENSTTAISGNNTTESSSILPYTCKQCGKAFPQKNHLANHCRIKKHSFYK